MCTRGLLLGLLFAVLAPSAALAVVGDGPPPCGERATPAASYEHVVWIFFENHGYSQIVGSRSAPFLNRTLVKECGLATNYHAIGHPSLPNYIAATSGLSGAALAPFGNDCNSVGP